MIERRFYPAARGRFHYRESAKTGAPTLVLLHPSPRNSSQFEPLMALLKDDFNLIAPDTPGYGQSNPLSPTPTDISGYLPHLRDFLHAVAGPRFLLYGSATGAQLGIGYANANPADIEHLFLDNAAHFEPADCAQMLAHYFPDISPRPDGSHLQLIWQMSQQMLQYFPWFEPNDAHCFNPVPPSPEQVHAVAMDIIAAGANFEGAYRVAFAQEHARHVQSLQVPTTVFRWLGSAILGPMDAMLTHDLGDHVQVIETPKEMSNRLDLMCARFRAVGLPKTQ